MKFIVLLLVLSLTPISFGQNLVWNSDFEQLDSCPPSYSDMEYATGWVATRASPDYFNSCATIASQASVPNNYFGYQEAASGEGYAGIYTYHYGWSGNYREYFGRPLAATMIVGQKYFISFKASLAIGSGSNCATNNLGILFSTNSFSLSNALWITNYPQFNCSTLITDTMSWTSITGSIIADSAYQFISIGNHFFDMSTTTYVLDTNTGSCISYYYIDDVCITPDSANCTPIPGFGMTANNEESRTHLFPNPTYFDAVLEFQNQENEKHILKLFNQQGQLVKTIYDIYSGQVEIIRNNLPSGLYYLQLWNEKQVIWSGRLMFE